MNENYLHFINPSLQKVRLSKCLHLFADRLRDGSTNNPDLMIRIKTNELSLIFQELISFIK